MSERVVINWSQGQWRESQKAFEMVDWCKQRNLTRDIDFTWNFDIQNQQTIFEFFGDKKIYKFVFCLLFMPGD